MSDVWQKVRQVQALEFWDVWEARSDPNLGPVIATKLLYSKEGHYVGAHGGSISNVLGQKGIKPELARPELKVCTIGWSERTKKWYGWSHRAIWGYGLGDTITQGNAEIKPDTPLKAHTLGDARLMAIAFAESVS